MYPAIYLDIITYTRTNPDTGLVDLCQYKEPIFYFKYIYAGYNPSVTNCSNLEPCPKKTILTISMQNNSFHINMIYTAIW